MGDRGHARLILRLWLNLKENEKRLGNKVRKKEERGKGEKKGGNRVNLRMDRWFFLKYFSFPQGNINSLLSTLALKCVF